MGFLERVRECFPSAEWEKPEDLPVYIARHGVIQGDKFIYSNNYPFVGNAKRFKVETAEGRNDIWNEQLVPWPSFVILVARPDEEVPLVGCEEDLTRSEYFFLIYADENGVIPFRLLKEKASELTEGFQKLREEAAQARAPAFNRNKWFGGMSPPPSEEVAAKAWQYFQHNGILISTV